MDQAWFEMRDVPGRIDRGCWIPLRAEGDALVGEMWEVGCRQEAFGIIGLLVPEDQRDAALRLSYTQVYSHSDAPEASTDGYRRAGDFPWYGIDGQQVVLRQFFEDTGERVYHLHLDLVLGLGLRRDGDRWIRPVEKDLEVGRLRACEASPTLEFRSEHLRDFLCARRSGLALYSYVLRREVFAEPPPFDWADGVTEQKSDGREWQGEIREFTARPAVRVLDIARDIDPSVENPVLDDAPVTTKQGVIPARGAPVFMASGEFWHAAWIPPAPLSVRVRGDDEPSEIQFIVEADGTKEIPAKFGAQARYLYFEPAIMGDVLSRVGSGLGWYTAETGSISTRSYGVPFGVSPLGLVNVFAKDIKELAPAAQRVWAAHNVVPEGPVSSELLAAQQMNAPASTKAPEARFVDALARFDAAAKAHFGESLLQENPERPRLLRDVHRFHGLNWPGLCRVAKEITRVVSDSLQLEVLKKVYSHPDPDAKSLAHLKEYMASLGQDGTVLLRPIAVANELRHADAHLPSASSHEALVSIDIDNSGDCLRMTQALIERVATALDAMASVLERPST